MPQQGRPEPFLTPALVAYWVGSAAWGAEAAALRRADIALLFAGWSVLTLLWSIARRPA